MEAHGYNAGQFLGSGIVSPERAQLGVDRVMTPDMFSGWGLRTYAAGQPGYNPIGYHTGTICPAHLSVLAAGYQRAGPPDEASLLIG